MRVEIIVMIGADLPGLMRGLPRFSLQISEIQLPPAKLVVLGDIALAEGKVAFLEIRPEIYPRPQIREKVAVVRELQRRFELASELPPLLLPEDRRSILVLQVEKHALRC